MSFAWPYLLWLLFVPAALLGREWTVRRKVAVASSHPKILRAEIGTHEVALTPEPASVSRGRVRFWLAAGLALAIVALARPQWGRIEEPMFDQSREILLAVDLSRSMLSPDVKPSRLDRAKLLIQALLEKLQGERVGLVVFSGTAFLQSPLSADYEILREFLPTLNPDFLPEGGTNYRALLDTALDAFGSSHAADRFLIILSDGEATDDDWKPRIDELKKRGIRVIGLGVGTTAGSMIPDGAGAFVKDERGAVVLSKLESATLQQLAEATGGLYRDASTWVDLAGVIDQTVNAGRKGEFVEKNTVRYVERFQWPLALALWCFFVSFYYEFPVRPRPRDIRLAGEKNKTPAAGPAAALAFMLFPALGLALALASFATTARAAVTVAPVTSTGNVPHATAPTPAAPPPLARIVGRLSGQNERSARDWAELAQETVSWGSQLQSAHQAVPEGPVRDALTAADLGAKLDPHSADWPKLREQLEALLQQPEEQQQQKDKSQQNDQKNQKDQSPKKDQKDQSSAKDQKQKQDQQNSSDKPDKPEDQKNPSSSDASKPDNKASDQSAFGDMNQKPPEPPPPPSTETQKVGGTQDKNDANKPTDAAMVRPMEKMDQLRNQDSPAELFQLMQGDRSQASQKKPAKNW